jgi:acyl transferase domain-containing protein
MSDSADSAELSPTKRALLALKQMQARLDQLEAAQHEPIAIIGMGCRFPGADNPAAFWRMLQQQQDAITDVPIDRWDLSKYYDPDPEHPGVSPQGGFLPHLFDFDASFFRIAPREAVSLDPQQRLLLEVSWEAIEQSGLAADQLVGSNTGVFVGISSIDYWQRLLGRPVSDIDAYLTTGNTHSLAAGRISYSFGFTGASVAIDTACSSSLVAVHSACQSLRQQECDLALAGGVNRILEPATSINFAKARMMSPSGRCRTFDANADGFVRAEGCGVVVLKRWQDALKDGDPIWAVILGSAVNHDGRSSGLTVPNGAQQQALIRRALQQSRVEPAQVSYVETHGTGTSLGDPIEVNALGAVFGDHRFPEQPLILGAVKTNIGHTEAAAGIAGLIKTVLALHHEEIPANLHLQTPNPHINWQEWPIKLPSQALPWPKGKARVAGVSAFGFSGTNAHVIVADCPPNHTEHQRLQGDALAPNEPLPRLAKNLDRSNLYLLPLSAKTESALYQLVERYRDYLERYPELDLADVCYMASVGRSHFNHRLAILAESVSELQQKLVLLTAGQRPLGTFQGRAGQLALSPVRDASYSNLPSLAQQYSQGASIPWSEFWQDHGLQRQTPRRKIALPTYPFQRQHFGVERT